MGANKSVGKNKTYIIGVAVALIIVILVGFWFFSNRRETYKGVYYPVGSIFGKQEYVFSPEFEILANCFAWALSINKKRVEQNLTSNIGFRDKADCGLNCNFEKVSMSSEGASKACDETYEVPL
ncbi:MAG: hypothetical protein UX43_C0003G0026 [Candidatus Giovannonibacteria bacterium GW2011_GWB1_46_20]|nr:MAG: hypothetical protein UX43_C0003G0026 [Candidatus Giovannonibacteria bacterium GW2011_GWB1_46_20]